MGMEHEETTEGERNVDVVIKTSIMGACLVTASTRSAGSREGGVILSTRGLVFYCCSIRVQKSTKVLLRRPQEGSKRGTVVVKILLLSIYSSRPNPS
jgi:hypothetical protein